MREGHIVREIDTHTKQKRHTNRERETQRERHAHKERELKTESERHITLYGRSGSCRTNLL